MTPDPAPDGARSALGDAARDWTSHLGLCSVTLRQVPAEEVIQLARGAGLRRIEWGADVHAPPGDQQRLTELGEQTRTAGLAVTSYGSYWRAGVSAASELISVAEAAVSIGAPRIRVWAGAVGSELTDRRMRDRVVGELRTACVIAREHELRVALEFHPDTLTDTVDSTLALLEQVDDPTLRTYWQPRPDEGVEPSLAGLRRLAPALAGVHVFSWWPRTTRLRLLARADLWSAVLEFLATHVESCDLLLEFVPEDDPALLAAEAQTLRDLLRTALMTGV